LVYTENDVTLHNSFSLLINNMEIGIV